MMSIATALVAIGLLSRQADAYPSFYLGKAGKCAIPDTGFGGHGAPVANTEIGFALMDDAGAAVTEWAVDTMYILSVTRGDAPFHAYVHTTDGTLSNDPAAAGSVSTNGDCTNSAWASKEVAVTHKLMWKAPACCSDGDSVTVSAATAVGQFAEYNTNMVTLKPAADTCSATCVDATKEAESADSIVENSSGGTRLSFAALGVALFAAVL